MLKGRWSIRMAMPQSTTRRRSRSSHSKCGQDNSAGSFEARIRAVSSAGIRRGSVAQKSLKGQRAKKKMVACIVRATIFFDSEFAAMFSEHASRANASQSYSESRRPGSHRAVRVIPSRKLGCPVRSPNLPRNRSRCPASGMESFDPQESISSRG